MACASGTRWRRFACFGGLALGLGGCGDRHLTAILPAQAPADECAAGEGRGAGPPPPMGWNGWNTFGCGAALGQEKFHAIADALVNSGLHEAGYEYMNLDDCWQAGRGADGGVLENTSRFPDGLAALGTYLHQKGLKLGIYSDVGACPRSQVTPPGSAGHEAQDAATYAKFGADYLKYNACGGNPSTTQTSIQNMRDALLQTGRPVLFSVADPPFKPWQSAVAQLWRTHGDVMPTWQGVLDILDATTKLAAYAGQGGYNDSDMLWVGNPGLSDTESRAYFSVWAILAAPLLASNDLTEMSAATRAILSQPDLIALNQDALHLQAVPLSTQGDVVILGKPLSQCGERGVVLLNRGEQAATGSVSFGALGLAPGPVTVRDLWAGTESSLEERFTATIAPHDAVALRLVGSERPLPRGEVYLSDLSFTYAANGWGPVETDRAVGESAAFDGGPITLAGHVYAKGLGVNSPSLVRYRLGKRCHALIADVGIDDITKGAGSALFQVWADGEKLFDSGVMVGGMAPVHVNVDVTAKSEVRLWVGEVEDFAHDHADWADARVRCDE